MTAKSKASAIDFSDADSTQPQPDETPIEETTPAEPVTDSETDEYEFVRLPGGKIVAVPKSSVQDADERPATAKQDAAATAKVETPPQEFYVHLANGDVERVSEEDLPEHAGGTGDNRYWQRDGQVHTVIGIYPVETKANGD